MDVTSITPTPTFSSASDEPAVEAAPVDESGDALALPSDGSSADHGSDTDPDAIAAAAAAATTASKPPPAEAQVAKSPPAKKATDGTKPMRLSETPTSYRMPPPMLGQHTDEVMDEVLGASSDEVAELRAANII